MVAAGAVHVARYPDTVERDVAAPATEVGPAPGVDLEAYAAQRHELLEQLPDDETLRAIVSFRRLVPVDGLPLPDAAVVERLHVLLPGEQEPRELPAVGAAEALDALFEDGRATLDREIADLEELLSEDVGDPAFEAEFTEQLAELRTLRGSAGRDGPVVFAAVVVAPTATLREVAGSPAVRLVDAAGPEARTRDTRFVGVFPVDDRASTERGTSPSADL